MAAVPLQARRLGSGPPVLVLHGLLGQGRNWLAVGRRLAEIAEVHLLDLRDHGASPWTEEIGYAAMAEDIDAYAASLEAGAVSLIGHSMGGKVAMTQALARPETVARLAVVDIAPVRYASGYEAYIRAMLAVDLAAIGRRSGAEAALAGAVGDPGVRAFLAQNLESGDDGLRWAPNLAGLLGAMPAIMDFPQPTAGRSYAGPVLILRGERSDYVEDAHRALLERLFPRHELLTIAGAGHWLHAEKPAETEAALRSFLSV